MEVAKVRVRDGVLVHERAVVFRDGKVFDDTEEVVVARVDVGVGERLLQLLQLVRLHVMRHRPSKQSVCNRARGFQGLESTHPVHLEHGCTRRPAQNFGVWGGGGGLRVGGKGTGARGWGYIHPLRVPDLPR